MLIVGMCSHITCIRLNLFPDEFIPVCFQESQFSNRKQKMLFCSVRTSIKQLMCRTLHYWNYNKRYFQFLNVSYFRMKKETNRKIQKIEEH